MRKGFTLIEIMVAVSIFIVVMTTAMGSILSIINANRQVSNTSTVMDNLNFTLETMSREIRFGRTYSCIGGNTTPPNCLQGGTGISFTSKDNQMVTYVYDPTNKSIEESVNSSPLVPLTGGDITVTSLTFYVLGATLDNLQPYVVIQVKGYAGAKLDSRSTFALQTVVSQRRLDIAP